MNYQELYQQKLTTAEEAVKVVKSGDWVDYSWCCNHPVALDKALAARKDELYDVKIRGGVTMWMPEVCKADDAGEHFTWNSWHCSGIDRKIIGKGMGFFGPMRYSELPRFYRDGNAQVDVAMLQVTPMDAHGNFSFAIDKALGAGSTENFESVTYEGYGPGGVAVIVDALTDNRQRTAPEVRHAFDKCNGNLGAQGCVSWSFDKKGVIVIDNEDQELDEDTVMMDALEAGAADFEADGMVMEVRCEPDDFNTVVKALEDKGYTFLSADIAMVPQNYITLTDEGDLKNMQKLIDMLEDNDDVQNVWHNWENE